MKIAKKIIFIGGIHGVGKGYLCENISSKYQIKHFSASDIIKWGEISNIKNKTVNDFDYTQQRLLKELKKIIKKERHYILDGHYCLLNSYNEPERIGIKNFQLINPKILVVVIEDIKIIVERLSNRDNINYTFELLKKMQDMEVEYALFLSKKINIPLINIYKQDYTSLIKHLEE